MSFDCSQFRLIASNYALSTSDRFSYELPSALADGTLININTGFSQISVRISIILIASAKAIRKFIYFVRSSAKALFVLTLFPSAKADGNSCSFQSAKADGNSINPDYARGKL